MMFDSMARMLIVWGWSWPSWAGYSSSSERSRSWGGCPATSFSGGEHWSFYFPLTTSILISLVLTLLFSLFGRR